MILFGPASTEGGVPPPDELTVTATSSLEDAAPSVAVNRSTYDPAAEKLAVVVCALTLPNVTVPGPLTLDQVVVSVLPAGKPSSFAVPFKLAEAGSVIVWSGPALTAGARFVDDAALTVILVSSVADRAVLLAVNRST